MRHPGNKPPHLRFFSYFAVSCLVLLATLICLFTRTRLEPTNLAMIYLLVVVLAAVWWGRWVAVVASFLSIAAFDFFLIPPYLTFRVTDIQYLFTFAVFLIVALVISELASKAKEQAVQRETEKLQTILLNSISHDLRTPLVSITGALSGLLQDEAFLDAETRKELLETAYEESDRLNRLVGNLLDMTRVEAGTLKVNKKPCDLRDVIGASLQQLKDKIEKRDVMVHVPQEIPEIPMDFTLIMRVFINLVDNAAKYSPADTPLEIIASMAGRKVQVRVKDMGFGVPSEDLQRIFDKFYRAVKPRQITGTGLGLSICKGIVEAHGGHIWAENNSVQGASVVLELPLDH